MDSRANSVPKHNTAVIEIRRCMMWHYLLSKVLTIAIAKVRKKRPAVQAKERNECLEI